MANVIVNAMGDACPIPVVKATKALGQMMEAGTLEVLVDNEIAVQNLTKLGASKGCAVQAEKKAEGEFVVRFLVNTLPGQEESGQAPSCTPDARGNLVVAVGSSAMGQGSDELGETLMKGFLFAVGQLPALPKAILFYNSGAKLTVEGSASLEDLRNLEAQGVEILTCGTCLNYYGLSDKLAVGSVTNMYSIVETLSSASQVIRP